MVKKYMHENLKHTVIKNIWPKKQKSIHTFRQLLPTIANMFQISYGGVYIMENKDAKTDYQELVRVGDQK